MDLDKQVWNEITEAERREYFFGRVKKSVLKSSKSKSNGDSKSSKSKSKGDSMSMKSKSSGDDPMDGDIVMRRTSESDVSMSSGMTGKHAGICGWTEAGRFSISILPFHVLYFDKLPILDLLDSLQCDMTRKMMSAIGLKDGFDSLEFKYVFMPKDSDSKYRVLRDRVCQTNLAVSHPLITLKKLIYHFNIDFSCE